MRHRHLEDDAGYRLAAIEDIIARGLWRDWVDPRRGVIEGPALLDGVQRVCQAFAHDPYAWRHCVWLNHVRLRRETA